MRSHPEFPFAFTHNEFSAHSQSNYGSSTAETVFNLEIPNGGGLEGGPWMAGQPGTPCKYNSLYILLLVSTSYHNTCTRESHKVAKPQKHLFIERTLLQCQVILGHFIFLSLAEPSPRDHVLGCPMGTLRVGAEPCTCQGRYEFLITLTLL